MEMENISSDGNSTENQPVVAGLPPQAVFAYNAYLSFTIAFGVTGNFLVLLVYLKHGPASSTDWFIIFITIFDFISSTVNVPIYLTFTSGAWRNYGSDVICKLHMFLSQSVVLSSAFLICSLGIERYWKICRPDITFLTVKKSRNTCLAISVVATLLSTPCFVLYHNKNIRCGSVTQGVLVDFLMVYYTGVLLSFLVVIIILIYTYSKIAATIIVSEVNMRKHLNKNKTGDIVRQKPFCGSMCCKRNRIFPRQSLFSSMRYTKSKSMHTQDSHVYVGPPRNETHYIDTGNAKDTKQNSNGFEAKAFKTHDTKVAKIGCFVPPYQNNGMTPVMVLSNTWTSQNAKVPKSSNQITSTCLEYTYTTDTIFTVTPTRSGSQRNGSSGSAVLNIQNINEHRRVRRSLKTTRIAFCICLIFVLSWLPPWVSFINFVFISPTTQQTPTYLAINLFCRMTYLINTFTNPILYTALNKTFREKLRKLSCLKKI